MMHSLNTVFSTGRYKRLQSGVAGVMALVFACALSQVSHAAPQAPSIVVPDTPFIEAVRKGDIEEVEATLVRGQTPDVRDKSGAPSLFVALQFNQTEMFRFLIAKGARVTAKDREGNTLLAVLANTKMVSLAELVIESGGDIDRFGANGEPPLIIASRAGEIEMVRLLLSHGADYEATDLTGRTALSIAQEGRNHVIADLLRDAGAY
jgi:uncharacterized protein